MNFKKLIEMIFFAHEIGYNMRTKIFENNYKYLELSVIRKIDSALVMKGSCVQVTFGAVKTVHTNENKAEGLMLA